NWDLPEAEDMEFDQYDTPQSRWIAIHDLGEVLAGITRKDGVRYAALTPNMRGYEAALAAGADEIAVFGSASEGFSRANINASVQDSLARFAPVVAEARAAGLPVRGYVSCVVECPYDGSVAPEDVVRVVTALRDMGCHEISLGDTIGRAHPEVVDVMLRAVVEAVPAEQLAGHFHDTMGRALDNIEVALGHGVRIFDAAVGGLGGCPYAPGAAGNVDSCAVARRVTELGYHTGLDLAALDAAGVLARRLRMPSADGAMAEQEETP
ncbi:MAG: hydroxymethylglutaryl-CoA lyase, partial [Paracoccaceae bacterium]